MIERWDPSEGRIRHKSCSKFSLSRLPPEVADRIEAVSTSTAQLLDQRQSLGLPPPPGYGGINVLEDMANRLESQGRIDAAFAYALRKVQFLPRYALMMSYLWFS